MFLACLGGIAVARLVRAQNSTPRFQVSGQATVIAQSLGRFHSPYSGVNSLDSIDQTRTSTTATIFLGARLSPSLEAWIDPEVALGAGVGNGVGLAGYVNGDVIRNPDIGQAPYFARAFLRWTPTSVGRLEDVSKDEHQFSGSRSVHRWVVTAGKFAANDLFDAVSYANTTRTQFMNWALINNAAYDYAADTRGYTRGVAVERIGDRFSARLGVFMMPEVANGPTLESNFRRAHGDQLELEWRTPRAEVFRVLGFRNVAAMGDYREAIAIANGGAPVIESTRKSGRVKSGLIASYEIPLDEKHESGAFARIGWNDGQTESFAYTEADDHVSVGVQLSGARMRRSSDTLGVAIVSNGISSAHRAYLAAGGSGFILGDGGLSYARETILESYLTRKISSTSSVTVDGQFIANPGYNRDRGPVAVFGLRYHFEF